MKIGILTRDEESWCTFQLREAFTKHGVVPVCFRFPDLTARVGAMPEVSMNGADVLRDLSAITVRPIGRGSLEETIFRLDLLHRLERRGMYILNSPNAIERSVDKYYALTLIEEAGLAVPRTVVAESANSALKAFDELGGDVVVKPIFGSRGMGSTRLSDPDIAERIFRTLDFQHHVLYLQEFVAHGNFDLRIFVLGGHILASMRRVADSWKTNVSLGARPEHYKPPKNIEKLALDATEAIGCEMTGIDILEGDDGPLIIELNSQPGWKGLQSVTKVNIADAIANHILDRIKRT